MKKVFVGCFVLCFWLVFSATGHCWPWENKAAAPAPKAPEVKKEPLPQQAAVVAATPREVSAAGGSASGGKEAQKASKASINKEKLLREKKKSALNDNQWDIEVLALNGKGSKQKDVLIFQDNKFSSEDSLKQGFKESNYTLTVLENDMVVVETMQTAENGGIIFWHIEFDTEMMACKGILSRQISNTKTEDYSFISIAKKAVQAAIPQEVPADKK